MNCYYWIFGVFVVFVVLFGVGFGLNLCDVFLLLVGKLILVFNLLIFVMFDKIFSVQDMQGKVWLFNVWVLWCVLCCQEYLVLVEFLKNNQVFLIGLNYKEVCGDGGFDMGKMLFDDEKKFVFQCVNCWLVEYGDFYMLIVMDFDGCVGINYGVYGVLEIYVIDKVGIICMKYIGLILLDVFDKKIMFLLVELNK